MPGLLLIGTGLALFARVPVDGSYLVDVLPTNILIGTGVGVTIPALMTLAMSGATREDAGLASALVNTSLQVGAAIGLAVIATISATHTHALIADGTPVKEALTRGYHVGFWVAVGLVAGAALVAIVVVRPESQAAREAAIPAEAG